MSHPEFDERRRLDHLQQLYREADLARLLRQRPSWRYRLARMLVRLAVRCEPRLLLREAAPPTEVW